LGEIRLGEMGLGEMGGHLSRTVPHHIAAETAVAPDFIRHALWPPNLPDVNTVD